MQLACLYDLRSIWAQEEAKAGAITQNATITLYWLPLAAQDYKFQSKVK